MKKIFATMLVLALLLTLAACGSSEQSTTETDDPAPETTVAQNDPEVETDPSTSEDVVPPEDQPDEIEEEEIVAEPDENGEEETAQDQSGLNEQEETTQTQPDKEEEEPQPTDPVEDPTVEVSPDTPEELDPQDSPDWGITLSVKNVSPVGLTLVYTQTGGDVMGDLETGSYYVVERRTQDGWEAVEYRPSEHEIGWTMEAWCLEKESTYSWSIDWSYLYGPLPAGEYRVGKEFADYTGSGSYDQVMLYAMFQIG